MRVPRIYAPNAMETGAQIELSDTAARHVVQVLRLAPGAALTLFDGRGRAFAARLESVRPARAYIERALDADPAPPLAVELLQGVSRGPKMDLVVQKAVELGVAVFTPLIMERSVMRIAPREAEKKRVHWEAIAISACEQCGRNDLPDIRTPRLLAEACIGEDDALNLLLEAEATGKLLEQNPPRRVRLLIGPEGGLAPAERTLALERGFVPLKLGPRVLRTETAAVAALAVIQYRWGDLAS